MPDAVRLTDVEVAARGMCRKLNRHPGGCICQRYPEQAPCVAYLLRPEAEAAVEALAAEKRLLATPDGARTLLEASDEPWTAAPGAGFVTVDVR